MSSVGKPIQHDSAVGHVTGAAPYLDDLVPLRDELVVGFVGSPSASGKITNIETLKAEQLDGVVGCFVSSDIPGEKYFGPNFQDEPLLADGHVLYVGQPVVVVAAEDHEALAQAKRAITIEIDESPPILSIEDAVQQQKFLGPARCIRHGESETALADAFHHLKGVFHCGGQEQFYLESQAAIAYPGEQGQMVVHSSTQGPSEIQHVVAAMLGLGRHEVVCICKRMGGAFGGKETQAAIPAMLAALVAHKTGRAARLIYNKDDDMQSTGKRHQFRVEWQVGFDQTGRIRGALFNLFSNGGCSTDLSLAVLERAMLHVDNAYYLDNVQINGRVCFTNLPSNTAFRGFGGPQAMAATESVIHEIANSLGLDPIDVQTRNLYGRGERNITPCGQRFENNNLPAIVSQLVESSDYRERRVRQQEVNQTDKMWLHGIALSPVKFGISFTTKFMNQANALVNVYVDGTVQVSTGATEMGQGVNTKIRQLVADEFGIDWAKVVLMPTSTEKNANTSPTAASASTDLNGAAAVSACQEIKERLSRLAARRFASVELGLCEAVEEVEFSDGFVQDRRNLGQRVEFSELCRLAFLERIDLGAHGFYATPGIDLNRETGRGNPFFYYTQGAAVAEVLIDRFTGQLSVPRVDLLIDIGKSINPGVDLGQIYGGFIQGMGWVTSECLVYDQKGALLSHSPTTYKIPAITDVPPVFNCELFDSNDNVRNIRRSKAVGEPPLMHAICVWSAVKQAIASLSKDAASELQLPATGEEVLRCLTLCESQQSTPGKTAPGMTNGSITAEEEKPVGTR